VRTLVCVEKYVSSRFEEERERQTQFAATLCSKTVLIVLKI